MNHESLDSMQALSPLLICYRGIRPTIADDAWIAPNATVTGDTEIGAQSSIWFGCIVRGDVSPIRIGARVNIQDGTIIHVSSKGIGTLIGEEVSIGHMALIHACTLQTGSFVGMGAVVMDGVLVETGAMIAVGRARDARQGGSNRSTVGRATGAVYARINGGGLRDVPVRCANTSSWDNGTGPTA